MARHQLFREHRGVYVIGHLAPIPLGPETGALLACGDGALLSARSAAVLWRLLQPEEVGEVIDVTVVGRQTGRPRGVVVHRTTHLDDRDLSFRQRLPVTSPARAMLDIAGLVTSDQLDGALDAGLAGNIVRPSQIRDVLDRSGAGRKGAGLLRALLDDRTSHARTSRSRYERLLRRLIRDAGLPEPELNVPLHGYIADCMWRDLRIVVVLDSYTYHGSRAKFESDRKRDAILKAAGWIVIRITRRQLDHEPLAVIARIAQTLTWAEAAGRAA